MTQLLRLARPQFLLTSLALYLLGASWALVLGAPYSLSRMILGYLIVLPAHLSVSFSNDYFDVGVDTLGNPTAFAGGSGILVDHPELRSPARRIALVLMVCSLALGVLFVLLYSYPIWFVGYVTLGNLLGWFYAAPPLRLAYRGLGELSTGLVAGLLLPGMGYVAVRGHMDLDGLLFLMPMTLYGLAFIVTVEIPDLEVDRLGNKRTLVARKGRGFAFTAVGALLLAATAFFFGLAWLPSQAFPLDFRLLGVLSLLPLGAGVLGAVTKPIDQQTATRLANTIIVTLAIFFALMDAYLVHIATS